MSNADHYNIGDVRCQLLAKNLPGLTTLNLGNIFYNLDINKLSDLAVRSVSQLHQLTELGIGTHALTQVGATSATRQPNSLRRSPSSPNLKSVLMGIT